MCVFFFFFGVLFQPEVFTTPIGYSGSCPFCIGQCPESTLIFFQIQAFQSHMFDSCPNTSKEWFHTPENSHVPWKGTIWKGNFIFQPSIFPGAMWIFWGGVYCNWWLSLVVWNSSECRAVHGEVSLDPGTMTCQGLLSQAEKGFEIWDTPRKIKQVP